MKNRFIITLLLSLVAISSRAQHMQSLAPPIPTSPQATSIKQHGDFEINYFTGVPDISIPLYEVNHCGYKIPLSIKYSPQPLKPGYNYDVFGHGWGLSINSCVSRTIKSLPDELNNFKIESNLQSQYYQYYASSMMTNYNWEHDAFNVTLPDGSSFEMAIDKDNSGTMHYTVSNGRNVKIQCNYGPYDLYSFVIIDENGVKYTFDGADTPYLGTSNYSQTFVSWQLTRIDLPNAPDSPILLEYANTIEAQQYVSNEPGVFIKHFWFPKNALNVSEDQYYGNPAPISSELSYKMKLLSFIHYGNTYISINYQNGTISAKNYVKDIRIIDNDGLNRVIAFNLNRRLVYRPGGTSIDSVSQLSRVKVLNPLQTDSAEVYRFDYSGPGSYYSFSGTDHWGYLNSVGDNYNVGRLNLFMEFNPVGNIWLAPLSAMAIQKNSQDLAPYYKLQLTTTPFVDNHAAADIYAHGILRKITYPTGGYTEFTFGNNRCLTRTDQDGNYIYNKNNRVEMNAGGFRINKITNYTADNVVANAKCYRYGALLFYPYSPNDAVTPQGYSDTHTGLGEAVVDPTILSYATFTSVYAPTSVREMLVGLDPNGEYQSFVNPFPYWNGGNSSWEWECHISVANFRRVLDGRSPVIYPEVTVYHGDIDNSNTAAPALTGKTVYQYDAYEAVPSDEVFFERPQYYGNTLSYEPLKYRYATLKEKRDYLYTGSGFLLRRKEANQWTSPANSVSEYIFANTYPGADIITSLEFNLLTVGDWFTGKTSYLGNTTLINKSITTYEGNLNGITTNEAYAYNSRGQMNSKTFQNSDNVSTETKSVYPEPSTSGTTPAIIQKMLDQNIIAPVLKSETVVGTKTVSGAKLDYAEFPVGSSTAVLPSQSYKLETKLTGPEYALEGQALSYSSHGNPTDVVNKGGMHTVYLWGYNDRYLIAEIKNASYAQVVAALNQLGISDVQNQVFNPASPNMTVINGLRQKLPASLIATYTYTPLVGVTSATDAKGLTTYYEYDSLQRLVNIKDKDGNIVKHTDYHYANQ
jgi:YD repeat-containing protein